MGIKNIIATTVATVDLTATSKAKILGELNPEQTAAVTFNEGPILVASVAGSGKCVTGDTIIATPDGPRRIDECSSLKVVSHSVDTSTLTINPAKGIWLDMGTSPIIEVKTNNGFLLRGTPEHPLLVWRGEPVWVRLDQLVPKDCLMLLPGYGSEHGKQVIDPEEAYLLGLMMGDGWTCRHETRKNVIAWSRGGKYLPSQFYNLVQRFWAGTPIKRIKKGTNSITYSWHNKTTYNRLHNLGFSFSSARDKHVPTWLIGASPAERIKFLQGYFDTDGSASGRKVEVVSASEQLSRNVHQMLLAIGVVARISPKTVKGYDHTYWRLNISGDQLRIFSDKVGFRYEQNKSNALNLIISKPSNPNKGCYPRTSHLLLQLKDQWLSQGRWNGVKQALDNKGISDYLHERRSPSKAKLLNMVDGCVGPVTDTLRNLTNFYLDPISTIKDAGSEHVYDFSIPGTHSFIANGIVSHNTRVIVNRIAHLVTTHKVNPSRILAVTFSKAGATEMNERLEKIIPGSGARIGTFHSVAYEICRQEIRGLSEWTIDSKDRYRYCIKDAAGFCGMKWKQCDVTMSSSFIGFCKANMARPHSDEANKIAKDYYLQHGPKADPYMLNELYEQAEELRRERQLLTFDDMMLDAAELLQDSEDVRQRWASKWDYVLQDEAQDQAKVQLVMGELLARKHNNYMLVGDPNQTIYSWRGAMPSMLLSFEGRWDATVIKMSRNYRCGQVIIDTANKVLDSMAPETRLDMNMKCEKGTEGFITCHQYLDLDDEAEAITDEIRTLLEDGSEPKDIAILFRTNAQSRAPEEALIGARIPYVIVGGTNFYTRKEVKNLLAYLKIAAGRGVADDVKRCINAPFRFLGKKFVEKVLAVAKRASAQAKREGKKIYWPAVVRDACQEDHIQRRQANSVHEWSELIVDLTDRIRAQGMTSQPSTEIDVNAPNTDNSWDKGKPVNLLEDIILATGYTRWLTKDEGEESTENSRVSNVRELVRAAHRFPTVNELLDYIEDIQNASKKNSRRGVTPNRVTLSTIHKSKGLEYDNVFMTGVNTNILPHARCEDIEEERRLFYVGVTRAKERLFISCVSEIAIGDRIIPSDPSCFIYESNLDPDFINYRNTMETSSSVPSLRTPENGPLFDS